MRQITQLMKKKELTENDRVELETYYLDTLDRFVESQEQLGLSDKDQSKILNHCKIIHDNESVEYDTRLKRVISYLLKEARKA